MKKIGVFGGSFDPVHLGHLLLAEQCREAAQLDQIRFIPASIPPHKQEITLTRSEQRVEMLRLAVGGNEHFEVDTCELERGGISYTVETLAYLKEKFNESELFLLIGADSLDEFHTWKDPQEICKLATPLVVERPGADPVDFRKLESFAEKEVLDRARSLAFESRMIDIRGTEIRSRVAAQQSIRYQTPRAVELYIREKKLFLTG